jgi:hypothetical protein
VSALACRRHRRRRPRHPVNLAMVLRYLPKFSSTSLEALLVEESIFRKKGRKNQFFMFMAQLLGKWNLFRDFQRVVS